jgi:starch synthase
LKILFVSSEVVPFAKTGGLADVAGALPLALAKLGHDVRTVMPRYASIDDAKYNLLPILDEIRVRIGEQNHTAYIKKTVFPDTKVPVYFVANEPFFGRAHLYGDGGGDYRDNATRFWFFCKTVLWLLKGLDWTPDVIHCNDWQSAAIPILLRTDPELLADEAWRGVRVLYTIHNLAYQGLFSLEEALHMGVSEDLWHPSALEFWGKLSLMKGGIVFSDAITTVSRRYAEEIQTPEYGCGLEGLLEDVKERLFGILNGIDTTVWDPASDAHLPAQFSAKDLAGKAICKAALQKEMRLPARADVPLLGIVSRLDNQKGFDLIAQVMEKLLEHDVQAVLLGTGAEEYHTLFEQIAEANSGKVSAQLRFDNGLAHRIEAGSDIFLMPSRYEPCGLNQMYSLRYGTVPVVRRTGGLADSIVDTTPEALKAGRATGFMFDAYDAAALWKTMQRALEMFKDKAAWRSLMRAGMAMDFSWNASAKKYEALYEKLKG